MTNPRKAPLRSEDRVVERREDVLALSLNAKTLVDQILLRIETRLDSGVVGPASVAQLVADAVHNDIWLRSAY